MTDMPAREGLLHRLNVHSKMAWQATRFNCSTSTLETYGFMAKRPPRVVRDAPGNLAPQGIPFVPALTMALVARLVDTDNAKCAQGRSKQALGGTTPTTEHRTSYRGR